MCGVHCEHHVPRCDPQFVLTGNVVHTFVCDLQFSDLTKELGEALAASRRQHGEDVFRLREEKKKLQLELSEQRIMYSQQEERVLMLQRQNNDLRWQVRAEATSMGAVCSIIIRWPMRV